MWIEEQKNGKFKFVERYKDEKTGKWRKVSLTSTKNTASVRKQMTLLLQEKIDQKQENVNDITMAELKNLFLDYYKGTVKPRTYYQTKQALNILIQPIADFKVDKIKAYDINQILDGRLNEGKSYNTVSRDKGIMNKLIRYGIKNEYITNAALPKYIEIPNKNRPKKNSAKFLEKHELDAVIDYLKEHDREEMARMVTIQSNTGLRFGEMASLSIDDIDIKNQSARIHRIYDDVNKIFTLPKTNVGRTIYLNDTALKAINKQFLFTKRKIILYGLDKDQATLFMNRNGKPINVKSINDVLRQIDTVDKKLSSHIFRHTYVSLAFEAGIDKETIIRQIGHASTKMINEIYLHVTQKMEADFKEKLINLNF